MSAYSEIAAATRTPLVAMAGGVDVVRIEVWDVQRTIRLGEFDCGLSLFGARLALADPDSGPLVIAAAWGVPGVRGHDPVTGNVRWERRDLTRSGPITADGGRALVCVGFGDRSAEILDAVDGTTVTRLRGARSAWISPFEEIALTEHTGEVALHVGASWERRWRAPLDGFALGAATFSPDAILYSCAVDGDSGQRTPVVCRALDGRERWRVFASAGRSVPKLAWDDARREWLAIEFDFARRRDELVRITTAGEIAGRWSVGPALDYAFVDDGRRLVTSEGSIVDTRTGSVVARISPARST